ncbi:tetratricopeptide repeat protein [Kitasatospora sp. NPDC006697]|uniref:tetratricopeptide repeat protein n=1 Tax=Kitasatospora sp. NPDC006697 TaxID=3364020 RepID=UPI0036A63D9A
MIADALREALRAAGYEATPEELADILWLAGRMPARGGSAAGEWTAAPDHSPSAEHAEPLERSGAPRPEGEPVPRQPAAGGREVYPPAGHPGGFGPGVVHGYLPVPRALPAPLRVGRALRALRSTVPSRTEQRIDTPATVRALADRLPEVVLAPVQEPELELLLVVDDGESMAVWAELAEELLALLRRMRVFRRCEVVGMDSDRGERVRFNAVPFRDRPAAEPAGGPRRLVLVLTDGVGEAWLSGVAQRQLAGWARRGRVGVLQVLPEELWGGGGLAVRREVYPQPGGGVVPVAELLADGALRSWAGAVGQARRGRVLPVARVDGGVEVWEEEYEEVEPEVLLRHFLGSADEPTRLLAAHLAEVAPLTIPLMRLVQQAVAPGAGLAQLAEVFTSGLLRAEDPEEAGRLPVARRTYGLDPETVPLLRRTIGRAEGARTRELVSAYLARQEQSTVAARALLAAGEGEGGTPWSGLGAPVAVVEGAGDPEEEWAEAEVEWVAASLVGVGEAARAARELLDEREYRQAVDLCTRALAAGPDLELLIARGDAFLRLGESGSALADFDAAAAIDRNDARAVAGQGMALAGLGELWPALDALTSALQLARGAAWVLAERAVVRYRVGQKEQAAEDLREAMRRNGEWSPSPLLEIAEMLGRAGRAADELSALELAVQAAPGEPEYWFALGEALMGQQEYQRAGDAFAMAWRLDPGNLPALTSQGAAYLRAGDNEAAMAVYHEALERDPENAVAREGLANALEWAGRYAEALVQLDVLFAADPENADLRERRDRLAGEAGTASDLRSAAFLMRAEGRHDESLEALDKAIRLDPGHARAHGERAETLRFMGRTADALDAIERNLRLDPADTWALGRRALILGELGLREEAIADLNAYLTHEPDAEWALRLRVPYLREADEDEAALADLDHLLAVAPDDPWALGERARIHRAAGRLDEAQTDLDRRLQQDPEDPWTLGELSLLQRARGEFQAALDTLRRRLEAKPDDPWGLGELALVHRELGDLDAALVCLDRRIRLGPDDAWALGERGRVHRDRRELAEALRDLDASLKLDSRRAWVLGLRGEVYRDLGDYEASLTDLALAVTLRPDDAWLMDARGQTLHRAGRYEEALACYQRALVIDPSYGWSITNRGRLQHAWGRDQKALEDYALALETGDERSRLWARDSRADCLVKLGRLEEALADYDVVVEHNPSDAWALGRRAQVKLRLGRAAEALAEVEDAIVIGTGDRDLRVVTDRAAFREWRDRQSDPAEARLLVALATTRVEALNRLGRHEERREANQAMDEDNPPQ